MPVKLQPDQIKGLLESAIAVEKNDGTPLSKINLSETQIVLFFCAEWHQWARLSLIPKLKENYENIQQDATRNVEFIFVSNDKTKEEYDRFVKNMPWASLGYDGENEKIRKTLTKYFVPEDKVGHPHVVVLHKNLIVCQMNAANNIMSGKEFPWQTTGSDAACMFCTALVFCTIL
eukprot:CAMPEP_0202442250 /NCGR_PEP_ID=MMETSP1360-20130828/1711_1 /ASSEMBLY_ACC=CAM_ASM_000848 /TAXON_ID=515479 /ORGANISM="Licmophora paradoxa, Strain CCMP2313" /LENGTH=174 /DNA_ID=CAMNT_0049057565 /DNA_START=14 /DNA_END=538 /DNA_ORIENTATION=+